MIKVVFENQHFIVCDKPSGVLSTPGRFEESDDRSCLGTELQATLKIQIYPIHRLDFEVSGLVMYAKNAQAHREANSWFEHKLLQKTYRALTSVQDFSHIPANIANPRQPIDLQEQNDFAWKANILRGKRRAYESPQGKPSLTLAKFLGQTPQGYLAWDLQPVTGRSHQLRFDLSRHGFPIVGDKLYGSQLEWGSHAIALRAYRVDFSENPRALNLSLPHIIETSNF